MNPTDYALTTLNINVVTTKHHIFEQMDNINKDFSGTNIFLSYPLLVWQTTIALVVSCYLQTGTKTLDLYNFLL